MKTFLNILLVTIVVILETTLVPKMAIFGAFPNLVMLVILSLIFINRTRDALWWVLIGGVLLDLFSPVRFGAYTLSFVVIFFLAYYLVNYVFSEPSVFLAAGIFFISSLILNIIFLMYFHYFGLYFIEAIYSTFVGCIVYGLIRYYYKQGEEVKI